MNEYVLLLLITLLVLSAVYRAGIFTEYLLEQEAERQLKKEVGKGYTRDSRPINWDNIGIDQAIESLDGYSMEDHIDTLDILLSEIRIQYQDQISQRQTIEQKISILVGINALLIGLITSSTVIADETIKIFIILPALLTVIIGLLALQLQPYKFPTKYENLEEYIGYTERELVRRQIYNNYWGAVGSNRFYNRYRTLVFTVCFIFTIVSISMIIGWIVSSFI